MVQEKTLSKVKALILSVCILFSASLFAQSETTSEKSTIVMTKTELDSFLTAVAEARRAQLKEKENKQLKQELAELRLLYPKRASETYRSANTVSNEEVLRELRYLNQRIDNLNVNNTIPNARKSDNSTVILPGNASQNAGYVPNTTNSTTVIPSNKRTIEAMQFTIDSLKRLQTIAIVPKKDNLLRDTLSWVKNRLENVRRQMDSLEQKMKVTKKIVVSTATTKENRAYFKQQVFFDNNSETLSPEYYENIQELIQILLTYPEAKVMLEGWASPLGKPDYNKQLSMRRAESVEKIFMDGTIFKNRILTSFRGEDTSSSAAQARRVDMSIIVR
jgi:outer membrane protein OmpA-like peptidoglycan-associated protein